MSSFSPPPPTCSRSQQVVARGAWVCAAGLIAMYLLLFAVIAASRLARPLEELTYGESWLLDGARQIARGEGLYASPDHLPLMQYAYTPLYYAVVGGLLRIFGDSGYTLGRTVSLLATLFGAAALAWSISRLTRRLLLGLLCAGLFLTQNLTVLLWATQHRVDPLALGLTLVGLALFTSEKYSLAAAFFVLAFFTKQTFVVAPLAAAITLWPCRVRLVRFAAVVSAGVLGGLAVALWLSHGWFWWHVVTTNANPPDLSTFAGLMGSLLQFNGVLLLVALVSLALPSRPSERVWRLYFVGSLLTLPTLAKLGASSNYWLELTAGTAVLTSLAADYVGRWPQTRLIAPTVIAGALLVALPGYQATAIDAEQSVADMLQPPDPHYLSFVGDSDSADAYRVDARFIEFIAAQPGDLLTDNSGLAVAAGKRITYEFQIFQLLKAEGFWSEQPILDAIAAQRFSLVALMHPLDGPIAGTRWSPGLQTALQADYAFVGARDGFWLYTPRR